MIVNDRTCVPLEDFIRSINIIADFVDVDTKNHSRGTKEIALIIAREMGIQGNELMYIGYGADIHDIGKVAISPVVFRQPSKLTRAQIASVKKHPEFGYEMIHSKSMPKIVSDCVLYHHEHWDGSGYPYGLKELDIPVCAAITCIADVWESINNDRPYRSKMGREVAIEFMKDNSALFNPSIYAAFRKLIEEEKL